MVQSEIFLQIGNLELYTVKPVYDDHLEDEVSAVVMDRWSL